MKRMLQGFYAMEKINAGDLLVLDPATGAVRKFRESDIRPSTPPPASKKKPRKKNAAHRRLPG